MTVNNDVDMESEELVIGNLIMTKSRREVNAWTRFDVQSPQNGKPGDTNLLLKPFDSYRIVAIYKETNKQTNTYN